MNELALPSDEGMGAAGLEQRFRKPRLNPIETSEYLMAKHGLPVAVATLSTYRTRGGGPAYDRWGRHVMYTPAAVDAWVNEKLGAPQGSTSEDAR